MPYDVLLDNQSIVSVFCQRDLLWNMQEVPVMLIGGITDGPKLSSNLSGEVIGADFRRVTYFENASANVLSYDLVADLYTIKWNQSKRQTEDNSLCPRGEGVYSCVISLS